jgi:hypothetical protein
MRQVMRRPRGKQFGKSDRPQNRMSSLLLEVCRNQVQGAELLQAGGAGLGKCTQQLVKSLIAALAEISFPVKRRKCLIFAMVEDTSGARNPIIVLGVDQVGDNIKRTPRALALVPKRPTRGHPPQ